MYGNHHGDTNAEKSKGEKGILVIWLYGSAFGGGGCLSSGTQSVGTLHDRLRAISGSVRLREMDYLCYNDGFLCSSVSYMADTVSGAGKKRLDHNRIQLGDFADFAVHDAAESMAVCGCPAFLGDLSEYSPCSFGGMYDSVVLWQCEAAEGSCLSLYVADDSVELWILYSGGALGRYRSAGGDADDPKDLCLCLDGMDWL